MAQSLFKKRERLKCSLHSNRLPVPTNRSCFKRQLAYIAAQPIVIDINMIEILPYT